MRERKERKERQEIEKREIMIMRKERGRWRVKIRMINR